MRLDKHLQNRDEKKHHGHPLPVFIKGETDILEWLSIVARSPICGRGPDHPVPPYRPEDNGGLSAREYVNRAVGWDPEAGEFVE